MSEYIKKSIWVFHLNTGSCNACDIEILDALTPYFDAERLGVKLVVSPRHADVLLLTGPITYESLPKVIRAIEAVPRPRFILALGSCAVGGGIWFNSYSTIGGFPKLLDVFEDLGIHIDKLVYVPGCPARPEAIIYGILVLLGVMKPKSKKEVVTIEGLAKNGELSLIQRAFIEEGAIQCGFCTPGFILVSKALLEENPNPSEDEIKEYIRGNLCRCTGYVNIIRAIKRASKYIRGRSYSVFKSD